MKRFCMLIMCCTLYITCGEEETRILRTCMDRNPSWASSDTFIAFYRDPEDQYIDTFVVAGTPLQVQNNTGGIYLLNRATNDVFLLTAGFTPDWSPNSTQIVFTYREFGDIWMINIVTGATSQLADINATRPQWSPQGDCIVCEKTVETIGVYLIYTTGMIRQIYGSAVEPSWHPFDGTLVFLAQHDSQYGICVGDTNGTILRFIKEATGQAYPKFSPDGTHILYYDINDQYVHIMDTLGNNDITLVQGFDPAWSPDSQTVIFVARVDSDEETCYSLWTIHTDGSDLQRLTYPDD
jgi:Tol biopolymer transport system component